MTELTRPLFNIDKVLKASIKLGIAVRVFLKEYDEIMDSPPSFKRGAETAEATNKLFKALILWYIDTDGQIRAGNVDQVIHEQEGE